MLKIGTSFTDGIRQYKIIDYYANVDLYRLKNITENKSNELMKEEIIKGYIENRDHYENKFNRRIKFLQEQEILIKQEEKEEEEKQKRYKFCHGFVNNKSKLQQGKILKTLNNKMTYNNRLITVKDFIEYLVKNHTDLSTKKFLNTNRYSKRKINGEYKKLVDKIEYRAYWDEQSTFVNLTKTEYDYCNYLLKL